MDLCPRCGSDATTFNVDMLFACNACSYVEPMPPEWAIGAFAPVAAALPAKPSPLYRRCLKVHIQNLQPAAPRRRRSRGYRAPLAWLGGIAGSWAIVGLVAWGFYLIARPYF